MFSPFFIPSDPLVKATRRLSHNPHSCHRCNRLYTSCWMLVLYLVLCPRLVYIKVSRFKPTPKLYWMTFTFSLDLVVKYNSLWYCHNTKKPFWNTLNAQENLGKLFLITYCKLPASIKLHDTILYSQSEHFDSCLLLIWYIAEDEV